MLDSPRIAPRFFSVAFSAIVANETGRSAPEPTPTRMVPISRLGKLAAKIRKAVPTTIIAIVAMKTRRRPNASPSLPPVIAPMAMPKVRIPDSTPNWVSESPTVCW